MRQNNTGIRRSTRAVFVAWEHPLGCRAAEYSAGITRRDEEIIEALCGCHDRVERVLALELRVASLEVLPKRISDKPMTGYSGRKVNDKDVFPEE